MKNSPYSGFVYANWTCRDYHKNPAKHVKFEGIYNDAAKIRCKCGQKLTEHNEIDLYIPKLHLVGHPDMLILYNGWFYIFEFKTVDRSDISFDDLVVPFAQHVLQTSFYYKMLSVKAKKMGVKVRSRLSIDYIDRSNSKLFSGRPYKTLTAKVLEDQHLDKFLNRLKHFVVGKNTGKLPARICSSATETRAKQCEFATECFARRNAFIENKKSGTLSKFQTTYKG
jgi:hypothetical protein